MLPSAVKPDAEEIANLEDDPSQWPHIAIVILHWNNYADTAECLESLHEKDHPNMAVVVVDNGSVDGPGNNWPRSLTGGSSSFALVA